MKEPYNSAPGSGRCGEVLSGGRTAAQLLLGVVIMPKHLTASPTVAQLNCASEFMCLEMLFETKILPSQETSRVMLVCLLGQSW